MNILILRPFCDIPQKGLVADLSLFKSIYQFLECANIWSNDLSSTHSRPKGSLIFDRKQNLC